MTEAQKHALAEGRRRFLEQQAEQARRDVAAFRAWLREDAAAFGAYLRAEKAKDPATLELREAWRRVAVRMPKPPSDAAWAEAPR